MDDQTVLQWFSTRDEAIPKLPPLNTIKTVGLQPVVRVFLKSANEVLSICSMPWMICSLGQWFRSAEIAASMVLFNEPWYEDGLRKYRDDVLEYVRLTNEHRKLCNEILAGEKTPPFRVESGWVRGDDIARHTSPYLRGAFDTLMAAQLILSWTAFETLAGDLWKEALNAHPHVLASRSSKSPSQKEGGGKMIPIWELEKSDFNASESMGTILRAREKFQTLDNIANAYRSAFPEPSRLNGEEFWNDIQLRSACAIRNLIVHKGGKVDPEFREQRGNDPRLAHYIDGDQISLDGALMQELIPGLFFFCSKLVSDVDQWIVANP